jgi:outer membrane protein assembly factor BamB
MGRFFRGVLVVAVLASTGGCFWGAPGQGPGRAAFNPFEDAISPTAVTNLQPAWTATTDDAWVGPPVVSKAAVHVTSGLAVYGFDVGTGSRKWKVDLSDLPFALPVAGNSVVDGDQLMTGKGTVNFGGSYTTTLRDPATGLSTGSPGANGLVDSVRGSTFVVHQSGFHSPNVITQGVSVFDRNDSTRRWSGLIDVWSTDPAGGGTLTLGSKAVYQAGFGATATTPTFRGNGLRSYPVTPPAPCASLTGFVCPTWSTALDGTTSTAPVLDDAEQTVFSGTDAGTVYAISATTGQVQWTAPVGAAVTESPALANGSLYVPTADGDLVVLDAATGAPRWTGATGSRIGVQPAVAGGVVFTGSDDGTVRAYDAAGCGGPAICPPLWSASTGTAKITGAPAVNAGQLYVGTDHRLVAYRLPPG